MDINLEKKDPHSIQSYDNTQITINNIIYHHSLIISKDQIIDWAIQTDTPINRANFQLFFEFKPEVLIIGHPKQQQIIPPEILNALHQQKIGLESMILGAACRTFNILLSEGRHVMLGIIF
jgi:uncharacterized protein